MGWETTSGTWKLHRPHRRTKSLWESRTLNYTASTPSIIHTVLARYTQLPITPWAWAGMKKTGKCKQGHSELRTSSVHMVKTQLGTSFENGVPNGAFKRGTSMSHKSEKNTLTQCLKLQDEWVKPLREKVYAWQCQTLPHLCLLHTVAAGRAVCLPTVAEGKLSCREVTSAVDKATQARDTFFKVGIWKSFSKLFKSTLSHQEVWHVADSGFPHRSKRPVSNPHTFCALASSVSLKGLWHKNKFNQKENKLDVSKECVKIVSNN